MFKWTGESETERFNLFQVKTTEPRRNQTKPSTAYILIIFIHMSRTDVSQSEILCIRAKQGTNNILAPNLETST
jgi:hypothetical protein